MLGDLKPVGILALAILAAVSAAAKTGPVVLKSPNGALEISMAAGGQLAYRVTLRGRPVLDWSNLGLLIEGAPALGPAVRIESSKASSVDETWKPVQGNANPIRNRYNAVTLQTVEMGANGRRLVRSFQTSNEGSYQELTTSARRPEMRINIPLLLNVPGVAGVKIDFLDRSDQWMVNFYRTVAKTAAEHHIMVDFHGASKPDGSARTFPNVLTREGVMGAEYNRWSARMTPKHNVTLAFTRMLAGPMDYTPGGFNNATKENFEQRTTGPMVMHTRAHATALFVVFESELQMVSDSPDAYDGQKELEFLKAVPASWDETRVIAGVPPKYITIARRRVNEWFVGSITNEDAREIDVPLSFLASGSYDAEIYSDGPKAATEPKDSVVAKQRVDAKTVLKLKLAPASGCAIRLVPIR